MTSGFVPPPPIPDDQHAKAKHFTPPPPVPDTHGVVPQGLAADSGNTHPGQAFVNAANAVGQHVVAPIATGLGKLLDVQRWGLGKLLTGETDPDKQRAAYRQVPIPQFGYANLQQIYDAVGKLPKIKSNLQGGPDLNLGHIAQGTIDLGLDTATDPLTYETAGLGPLIKGLGLTPKAVQVLTKTPLGRLAYDFTHWGGEVNRTLGTHAGNLVRGALNMSSAMGEQTTAQMMREYARITKGLTDDELVKVGKALNGEILPSRPSGYTIEEYPDSEVLSTPQEQSAYRQLRTLTEKDFQLRTNAARSVAFNSYAQDLNAADQATLKQALTSGKPPQVPDPIGGIRAPRKINGNEVFGPRLPSRTRVTNPREQAIATTSHDINTSAAASFASDLMENKIQPQRLSAMLRTVNPRITDSEISDLINSGATALRDKYVQELKAKGIELAPQSMIPNRRFNLHYANQPQINHAQMLLDRYNKIEQMIEEKIPKRENYMPWAHEPKPNTTQARTVNPSEHYDPRMEQREAVHVTTPEQIQRGFEAMTSNTGRQVTTGLIHDALGQLLNEPSVKRLMEKTIPATGNARTDLQKVGDVWRAIIGYPRAATVSLTPRHVANILDLLVNTVPPQHQAQVLKDTMTLAARLVSASPEEYEQLTAEGRRLGALSGNFSERTPFFQKIPVLKNWTAFNNKLVWAVDEAAKQTYAKLLVKTGEAEGLEAGGLASSRLVDYEHLSPLQNVLRHVAPFGTFRGGIPGAVLGGVARNPARAAALNRISQGTMYGGQPQRGQHGAELYNPTADVGRGLDAPQEYLRGTLGAPVQAATTLGIEAITGHPGASLQDIGQEIHDIPRTLQQVPGQLRQGHIPDIIPRPEKKHGRTAYADTVAQHAADYLNYGKPIDLRWLVGMAAAGVPEARNILDEMHQGQFSQKPGTPNERITKEAILQVLGVGIK